MHGIQTTKRHLSNNHLKLRGWYARKRKQRVDAQIRDILGLRRAAETPTTPPSRINQPYGWFHKTEALSGDTVYLGHNNSIRSFVLSAFGDTTDAGKVSITSPIGRALIGKHLGDVVRLQTLDGKIPYTVLKII